MSTKPTSDPSVSEESCPLTLTEKSSTNTRLEAEKKFLLHALRQLNETQMTPMTVGHCTSSCREEPGEFVGGFHDVCLRARANACPLVSTIRDPEEPEADRWNEYSKWIQQHDTLKTRLEQINELLQEVGELFETSEYYELTGYRGFPGWAKIAFDRYAPTCDSISVASVFGAGITYTTVFSASRGDISLMCWAFALFDVGFIISLFVRSSLLWCSRLPAVEGRHERITKLVSRSPKDVYKLLLRIGDVLLLVVMSLAFATQVVAIFILNVTLLQLSDVENDPELTMSPVPSAILSLGAGALGVLVSSGILIVHWMTHGFKSVGKPNLVATEELFL
ncbi:hypothetical protein PAXRUDRAFT_832095 [Paxillus rubicundulus Ve08.2h10]|uniref:Uncharacterized protein n=1 Tax=Paxillus rubicundulus Ve08.2h10 TaxID=930991 RepID=A0A0D0CKF1_9AGAM|nr:hypothetical protein PAXRUDRAFT_832095 [Paxillus rubicundulus Ve08.2h10]